MPAEFLLLPALFNDAANWKLLNKDAGYVPSSLRRTLSILKMLAVILSLDV